MDDHVLVDKLAYSPPGSIARSWLPYQDVKRGDIIVFRYPVDIRETYVKRCMGLPGDRLKEPGISPGHAIDLALHFFDKTRWDRTFRLVRGYPVRP